MDEMRKEFEQETGKLSNSDSYVKWLEDKVSPHVKAIPIILRMTKNDEDGIYYLANKEHVKANNMIRARWFHSVSMDDCIIKVKIVNGVLVNMWHRDKKLSNGDILRYIGSLCYGSEKELSDLLWAPTQLIPK
jgi:hypothetical protein